MSIVRNVGWLSSYLPLVTILMQPSSPNTHNLSDESEYTTEMNPVGMRLFPSSPSPNAMISGLDVPFLRMIFSNPCLVPIQMILSPSRV